MVCRSIHETVNMSVKQLLNSIRYRLSRTLLVVRSHHLRMSDPFARAIHDFHQDEQDTPLVQRDGGETLEHPIERFYFGDFTRLPIQILR